MGIAQLSNMKKQKDLDELLKANTELKQTLLNLAKKNQDIIASKCKDFKKCNVKLDKNSLSAKNNILTITLGYWEPKHPDRDDIFKLYVDNFVDMDNYPDYDSKEDYVEHLANIDICDTLREFCGDDADEMFKLLEKKYHINKSYKTYLQLVDEIDKSYSTTTNSTLLSAKVDHGSTSVDEEDEAAEICFYSIDAGTCNLVVKYQDYNNIRLPESIRTLVNTEIERRKK